MPTINSKATGVIAELGKLNTFSITSSAVPYDVSNSNGTLPAFSASYAATKDAEFLMGESLTLESQGFGTYAGEIVTIKKTAGSTLTPLDADTLLSKLNSDVRTYTTGLSTTADTWVPIMALDAWSQECGLFYDDIEGSPIYYWSAFGHNTGWVSDAKHKAVMGYYSLGTGGIAVGRASLGDRRIMGYGADAKAKMVFAEADRPNLTVPTQPGEYLTISGGAYNQGTLRVAHETWTFVRGRTSLGSLRLRMDSNSGYYLQIMAPGATAYTTLMYTPSLGFGHYYISLRTLTATTTEFTLAVYNSAGGQVYRNAVTQANCPITGQFQLSQIDEISESSGSDATQYHWGHAIAMTKGVPMGLPRTNKTLLRGTVPIVFAPGFSGNAWEHIKQWCSLTLLDIRYEDGRMVVGPRETTPRQLGATSALSMNLSKRDPARFVEVVNYNAEALTNVSKVLWAADTVYQVAVGEVQEFLVQTDHSIDSVNNPVAVSGITPYPYVTGGGQYVVTGSDGYIVSPAFWRDQGGSISADTTDNDGEIKITITAPTFDSPRAPYRISEGDAGRPALYITGLGVLRNQETLRVGTGNSKAAKEVGVKIDIPFVGDANMAYTVAARAARAFSGPEITADITEGSGYAEPCSFGTYPAGSLFQNKGNTYRLVSATQTPFGVTGSAEQHNTLAQINNSFASTPTIGEINAYRGSRTIGQINIKPLKEFK